VEPGWLGLLATVLIVVLAFALLARAAARGSRAARVAALVQSVALAGCGLPAFLLALFLFGVSCDESCDVNRVQQDRTGNWWHSVNAWQWWAELGVAGFMLVALIIALRRTLRRKHAKAAAWMAVAGASFLVWLAFIAPTGDALGI